MGGREELAVRQELSPMDYILIFLISMNMNRR